METDARLTIGPIVYDLLEMKTHEAPFIGLPDSLGIQYTIIKLKAEKKYIKQLKSYAEEELPFRLIMHNRSICYGFLLITEMVRYSKTVDLSKHFKLTVVIKNLQINIEY